MSAGMAVATALLSALVIGANVFLGTDNVFLGNAAFIASYWLVIGGLRP